MMIKPDVHGFFDQVTATWTYVVWAHGHEDKRCAIIDSVLGYDPQSGATNTATADCVIDYVKSRGLDVQWVLETHIHADHLTAARYIKEKMGGKTAITKHILKVIEMWRPTFHSKMDIPLDGSQFDHLFDDEEHFTIGSLNARTMYTPGHTPSDTTYLVGDCVFVGDAMLLPDVGTGRCDFPGGSAEDSFDSSQKLFKLPDHYKMYVGHDCPPNEGRDPQCMTTIGEQKTSNIRVREGIKKEFYVKKRNDDDLGKAAPRLLLPSIQVNLQAGRLNLE
jgi:glyoxylase-like metal-dependent hydrolase (beta-lactamase superfamily II)